jgi:hypothetical protein
MKDSAVGCGGALNFLGLSIASGPDNLGTVSLTRTTGDGSNGNPNAIIGTGQHSSIACNWNISVTNQPTAGRDITFQWLSDLDNVHDFTASEAVIWKNDGTQWATFGNAGYAIGPPPLWTSPTVTTTSFSQWTVTTQDNPLPVELLDFLAKCSNNKVNLNWSTASETNNNYFTIERSKDYYTFEKVLDYPGAGNSNHLISYGAVDESPFEGNSFYRLKQTDYNGAFTYSGVVPVNCGDEQDFNLIAVTQGPQDYEIIMTFAAVGGEQYTYSVYDITGKLMRKITDIAAPGFNEVHINFGFIAEALYMVTLQSNEKSFSRKVVLK